MSSREFTEWRQFYELEPFGPRRDNFHAGLITSSIFNVNRDRDKHPEPFLPSEFMLGDTPVEEKQSPEDIYDALRNWALLNGAEQHQHGNHSVSQGQSDR